MLIAKMLILKYNAFFLITSGKDAVDSKAASSSSRDVEKCVYNGKNVAHRVEVHQPSSRSSVFAINTCTVSKSSFSDITFDFLIIYS